MSARTRSYGGPATRYGSYWHACRRMPPRSGKPLGATCGGSTIRHLGAGTIPAPRFWWWRRMRCFLPRMAARTAFDICWSTSSTHYRVILLTGWKGSLTEDDAARYFAHSGPCTSSAGERTKPVANRRGLRAMRSHSHEGLGHELSRTCSGGIQSGRGAGSSMWILALLAARKSGPVPWILTLHDVLLSGDARPSAEDRFELEWIGRFDHLIACCEDGWRRYLRGEMPASVVPNGRRSAHGRYISSAGLKDLLFLGPFPTSRLGRNPGVSAHGVSGAGGQNSGSPGSHFWAGWMRRCGAAGCEAFRQPGVYVHDHLWRM